MNEIVSPMPGKILKILVNVGDAVNDKTVVCIHEAMKMENSIYATCNGTIREIMVREGDNVEINQKLALVE